MTHSTQNGTARFKAVSEPETLYSVLAVCGKTCQLSHCSRLMVVPAVRLFFWRPLLMLCTPAYLRRDQFRDAIRL
jgi:hypothetical protein